MKQNSLISRLCLLVLVAIFINACATTQEVSVEDESLQSGTDGVLVESDGVISITEDDVGASASAFTDEDMTAQIMLAQSDYIF